MAAAAEQPGKYRLRGSSNGCRLPFWRRYVGVMRCSPADVTADLLRLILQGPAGGENSQHLQLTGFDAPESLDLLQAMAEAKGFALEPGAIQSPQVAEMAGEMCRLAAPRPPSSTARSRFPGLSHLFRRLPCLADPLTPGLSVLGMLSSPSLDSS